MLNQESKPLLEVNAVSKNFGGLAAVHNVTFNIFPGELVSIIGPNGAGKTTLLNLIAGAFPLSKGEIWFNGQNVSKLRSHQVCSMGIARTFQNLCLFANMSVIENAMIGCEKCAYTGWLEIMAHTRRATKNEQKILERALEMLVLVGLEKNHMPTP